MTVFSTPPAADTRAPTFQRLSARFGILVSTETSVPGVKKEGGAGGGSMVLNFRVWTILWAIIALSDDESSDSILLNPF